LTVRNQIDFRWYQPYLKTRFAPISADCGQSLVEVPDKASSSVLTERRRAVRPSVLGEEGILAIELDSYTCLFIFVELVRMFFQKKSEKKKAGYAYRYYNERKNHASLHSKRTRNVIVVKSRRTVVHYAADLARERSSREMIKR
jgi:hypothetical protein